MLAWHGILAKVILSVCHRNYCSLERSHFLKFAFLLYDLDDSGRIDDEELNSLCDGTLLLLVMPAAIGDASVC